RRRISRMNDKVRPLGADAEWHRPHQPPRLQLRLRQDTSRQGNAETIDRGTQQEVRLAEGEPARRRADICPDRTKPIVPRLQRNVQQLRIRQFLQRYRQLPSGEAWRADGEYL